ncbi:hypothetical protein UF64_10125 [Thalassospira sp. HJ]|nr:hypothetical protein UF64_10125 [Thalassospira sp. HJ]
MAAIFASYGNSIAAPMTEDLQSGTWKIMPDWKLSAMIDYLSGYGTSAAIPVLREIEKEYPVSDIQTEAKEVADHLATLEVAVSEARKLDFVQTALSSGDANAMAKAGLLALSQIDPDWDNRASEIQTALSKLARDCFPAVNEIASGKVTPDELVKALIEILFEDKDHLGTSITKD